MKQDTNVSTKDASIALPVVKSVNTELKQATYVVMAPDEVDLHGDTVSADEIRKACHNFNKFCSAPNLFHVTGTDLFEFSESFIAPVDFQMGERIVKAGTWLAVVQAHDETLWGMMKSGEINGLSIGAMGVSTPIEGEE